MGNAGVVEIFLVEVVVEDRLKIGDGLRSEEDEKIILGNLRALRGKELTGETKGSSLTAKLPCRFE